MEPGCLTRSGFMPKFKNNSLLHAILFTFIFIYCSDINTKTLGWYKITIIWDLYPGCITLLNIFGLVFCFLLYLKGLYFPSTRDSGSSNKGLIFDYYWGTELYPKILGIDIKHFINCRFSMTYWMVSCISFFFKSVLIHSKIDYGLLGSCLLQYIYLFKFFYWEIGYMRSLDIIEDRAGFYETWGCLVWVPVIYTLSMRVTILSQSNLPFETSLALFILGLIFIFLNFWSDQQRRIFRESNGKNLILTKNPNYLKLTYNIYDDQGNIKDNKFNLFLTSGLWGFSRHSNYIFEILSAFSWTLLTNPYPLGNNSILSWFYPIYLIILLLHRSYRDEKKCLKKYGDEYLKYMQIVPYKIIPFIF